MIKFFNQLKIGYISYWKAIKFIFNHKLFWYFLFPVLLNILLFAGGTGLIIKLIKFSTNTFVNWLHFDTKEFWGHQLLNDFFLGLIIGLITIMFFIAYMFLSAYVIMILLSPILSLISEKTDSILTNSEYPFVWKQFLSDIWRGVKISLRNMLIEFFFIIVCFIISFIPIIGLLSPFILFIVSAYFYGFAFMDYTNERNGLSVKESVKFVRKNKGLAWSNGSVFALFLLIPFCGASIGVFVSLISSVAATLSINNQKKNQITNPNEYIL